ncbi:MAG: hypothetical protein LBU12_05155 [Deltaproteobacteria bacterium]|jgi:hypothetical protein|nr:hypothetical protein [Deltaproteobacteria bacterium]
MSYIYSGVCLAAMFGSIIYEHRRLKKEEHELRERMKILAERTKKEFGIGERDLHVAVPIAVHGA